jgi:hypothetical protein
MVECTGWWSGATGLSFAIKVIRKSDVVNFGLKDHVSHKLPISQFPIQCPFFNNTATVFESTGYHFLVSASFSKFHRPPVILFLGYTIMHII